VFDARVDQLVYDFNCRPLAYAHASWLQAGAERAALERVSTSSDPSARAWANLWLLRRFGLLGRSDFDFAEPGKRLLLLDGAALRDLALWLGLSALLGSLRTWVRRADQLRLRQALGVERHDWFTEHLLPWPAVARWPLRPQDSEPTQITALAERLGTRLLLCGADAPGGAAVQRARLKLPSGLCAPERKGPISAERREAVLTLCITKLIRERHPTWHWLF
jgi:type III secretion protein K